MSPTAPVGQSRTSILTLMFEPSLLMGVIDPDPGPPAHISMPRGFITYSTEGVGGVHTIDLGEPGPRD